LARFSAEDMVMFEAQRWFALVRRAAIITFWFFISRRFEQ
jgi:hypothetical protein